jgi:hypothetical protein
MGNGAKGQESGFSLKILEQPNNKKPTMKTTTHTHTTEITLEVEIEYEYDPGEKRVDYYPDGSGHPGTDPSVAIHAINTGPDWGNDISHALPQKLIDELAEEILESHDAEGEGE